ncbi:MAG: sodium:alanine symporter family protein [Oscillospiraceae bacterium]|nr:sodium:alanine symporter family protein [Oscillospiraceae bacterium]
MLAFLEKINHLVWGVPALFGILGVGIYLTLRTGFAQFRFFPQALRGFFSCFFKKDKQGDNSPFQALCTALAATVGTGNLAGVAGAIALGGPGAIFWMWVCGFLGMVTKFAEATLAVRYRKRTSAGELIGGPMVMIEQGLGKSWRWLGMLYSFFAVVASFGVGNATQINAVIGGVNSVIAVFGGRSSRWVDFALAAMLAVLICVMLFGGARRIGSVAERLIPFASVMYLLLCAVVLIGRFQLLPSAFAAIFAGAFSPKAVTGGMIGSFFVSLRVGASRGVFTNEAGMGTASIAHAGAKVKHPVEQGLMGIMEVFLDTIVICTMTALVILCSGVQIPYGIDTGILLTNQAFSQVLGDWVSIPIAVALCLFAVATVVGWGLYGARSAQYLFGENSWKIFAVAQGVVIMASSFVGTGAVWLLAEIVNGFMAIPNLIVLTVLSPELTRLVREYSLTRDRLKC